MTTQDLIALCDKTEELSAKATAGPWVIDKSEADTFVTNGEVVVAQTAMPFHEDGGNAAFIAHSRAFTPNAAKMLKEAIIELQRVSAVFWNHYNFNEVEKVEKVIADILTAFTTKEPS